MLSLKHQQTINDHWVKGNHSQAFGLYLYAHKHLFFFRLKEYDSERVQSGQSHASLYLCMAYIKLKRCIQYNVSVLNNIIYIIGTQIQLPTDYEVWICWGGSRRMYWWGLCEPTSESLCLTAHSSSDHPAICHICNIQWESSLNRLLATLYGRN